MKSLLPNNFKNPSAVDKPSSGLNDLGNIGQGLGKKDAAPTGGGGFADFLMQSIQQEKHSANMKEPQKSPSLSAPSSPTLGGMPNAADRQVSSRMEQDLAERRNSQIADRTPTALRDRDDDNNNIKDKAPDRDAPAPKLTKANKPDLDKSDRLAAARNDGQQQAAATGTGMSAAAAKDLRPLKMAVGGKSSADAMAGNNPVLAFVTGRLDRIDPEGIPSIITGNPLLSQIAAAGEVSDIMLQPMPISDLCKIFEISETVVNKAMANGLNTDAMVTPKDFLNAIGVDAGRVSSELQMLQQKLPIDGVHSYVERARAMGQKLNKAVAGIGEGIPVEVVSALDHAGPESLSAQQAPSSRPDEEKPGLHPTEKVPVGVPNVPNVAVANAGKPAAPSPANVTKVDTRSRPQASPGDLMESLLANRAMGLSVPAAGVAAPKEHLDMGKLVDSDSSELDPYAMLGQDMKPFQTDTTTFAPVTVGKSMANLEEQMAANGFSLNHKITNQTSFEKSDDVKDLLSDRRADMAEMDSGLDLHSLQDAHNSVHGGAKNLAEGVTLAVEGMSKGSDRQSSFQESMSGGSDEKESGFSKESLTHSLGGVSAHGATHKTQEFGEVMGAATTTASEQPKEASGLHNKIMQHAAMMLKDGGGSMRMNVDAPGMGKIDLAINLSHNQLDVRILTPNDHVRDIINKELSGLRDGLGQQGISLRAVEVSNASQSSNQFAGGRFGQGHNGQQASYNEMKEYAESFAGSFTSRGSQAERMRIADVRNTLPSSWMNMGRENSKISVRI